MRASPAAESARAGAELVPAGSWTSADPGVVIVGIKELPDDPAALPHRHVFFGHAYKGQQGADELLARFAAGGGELLDLEYLVDERGRRVVAFGYWAGFVGAALGALQLAGGLRAPLEPLLLDELLDRLEKAAEVVGGSSAVVGAGGTGDWTSRTYTVVKGDTLSKISKEMDGDANKYNKISEANKPLLSHPDKIYPGQTLRIPE